MTSTAWNDVNPGVAAACVAGLPHGWPSLAGCALLDGLSPQQAAELLALAEPDEVPAGHAIIEEGASPDDLVILVDGAAEVSRKGSDGSSRHVLVTVEAPGIVGELSLIDHKSRSASVRAVGRVRLLRISIDRLCTSERRGLYSAVLRWSASSAVARLRHTDDLTVQALEARLREARQRIALGIFFVYTVASLAIYAASLRADDTLAAALPGGTRGLSLAILCLFSGVVLAAMVRSGYPLSFYGLNLVRWRRSLAEGLLFTVPVLAVITLGKYLLMQRNPALAGTPLFNPLGDFVSNGVFDLRFYLVAMGLYIVLAPLQEMIVRGGLQTALQNFLAGPPGKVAIVSIVTSNLVFAMAHSHLGLAFVLAVLLPGLYFGWLYVRHGNLVGPTAAHILVGLYAHFLLGSKGVL